MRKGILLTQSIKEPIHNISVAKDIRSFISSQLAQIKCRFSGKLIMFLTQSLYRAEGVDLCFKYTAISMSMSNLGQFCEKLIFLSMIAKFQFQSKNPFAHI